ncbi:hypothetical protein BYT27DRAFT_7206270 [Phlegmacium glaucopus]|nr:hypothetical protein BYT27DRAFT_7206270 [Phlegmacium glaucopus]
MTAAQLPTPPQTTIDDASSSNFGRGFLSKKWIRYPLTFEMACSRPAVASDDASAVASNCVLFHLYAFFYHAMPEEGVSSRHTISDIWLTRFDEDLEKESSSSKEI